MKKLKNILFWIVLSVYLTISLAFTSNEHFMLICNNVNVFISDSSRNSIINEADVLNFLMKQDNQLQGKPLELINSEEVEKKLTELSAVKNAEVFKTVNGAINVMVFSRKPLLRIFPQNGENFYIDEEGRFLPSSDKFTSHNIIANGNIPPIEKEVFKQNADTLDKFIYSDLYKLAKFVRDDIFWNSQIEQIYVNSKGDFELIPRVGSHIILFGNINQMDKKFRNLKSVYEKGFTKNDWLKYHHINLKYDNQVICSKK